MRFIRTKHLQRFQRLKLVLTCSRVLSYCHGTRLVFSLLTAGLTTLSVQLMAMGYMTSVRFRTGTETFFRQTYLYQRFGPPSFVYNAYRGLFIGGDAAEACSCIFIPHTSSWFGAKLQR